ncbi:MAG: DoxX family protein [Polyangiales bacterium]|nr:DoxX family protein [Sandaracinaceae bacterium]
MIRRFDAALARHQDRAYALLRFVAGFMFTFHGVQKIFGLLTERPSPPVGSQLWVGGLIELVCGALVAVGAFTRPAAFLASGTMAVAYAQFHWSFAFDQNFFPVVNRGELAALYAVVLLYIACRGPGHVSVDGLRKQAG